MPYNAPNKVSVVPENTSVCVQDLTKKYRLFRSPRERLKEALHPFQKRYHQEFWALKGISFIVPKGLTLGILGRNGSGKSTLLQIIASVLQPTSGVVTVEGRVSALLELGAGFNPEFTGRENVLLNGTIMGVPRREMLDRMAAIRDFADIGEFLDQPVKTYSSGMYARLAFACAINVDPDILIIDEVLSVGDAKFQNKCFSKLREFQKTGKTILLVSHSVDAIIRNTEHAILLESGQIMFQGRPKEAVDRYFELLYGTRQDGNVILVNSNEPSTNNNESPHECDTSIAIQMFLNDSFGRCENRNNYNRLEFRFGVADLEIMDYLVVSGDGVDPVEIESGRSADIYIKVFAHKYISCPSVGIAIKTVDGTMLYGCNTMMRKVIMPSMLPNQYAVVQFSMTFRVAGRDLFVDVGCGDWSTVPVRALDRRHSLIHIQVQNDAVFDGVVDLDGNIELVAVSQLGSVSVPM